MSWSEYYERVGKKPNSLVVKVVKKHVTGHSAALDLGAGNLRDAKFLAKQGFKKVVAVDRESMTTKFATPGIEMVISPMEDYLIEPDAFNLVVACNSCFFISPENMRVIFNRVYQGLRHDGIFTFNLMGEDDEAVRSGWRVYAFTKEEILKACDELVLEEIKEDRYFAQAKEGQKFWHLWSVIARKR